MTNHDVVIFKYFGIVRENSPAVRIVEILALLATTKLSILKTIKVGRYVM